MSWANFFPPVTWEPIASVGDGGLPVVDVGLLANAQHQMLNPFVVYSRTNATPVAAARRNRKNMMACMCRRKIGKYVKKNVQNANMMKLIRIPIFSGIVAGSCM